MTKGVDLFVSRNRNRVRAKGPIKTEADCERLCAFYQMRKERGRIRTFDFALCLKGCRGEPITDEDEEHG